MSRRKQSNPKSICTSSVGVGVAPGGGQCDSDEAPCKSTTSGVDSLSPTGTPPSFASSSTSERPPAPDQEEPLNFASDGGASAIAIVDGLRDFRAAVNGDKADRMRDMIDAKAGSPCEEQSMDKSENWSPYFEPSADFQKRWNLNRRGRTTSPSNNPSSVHTPEEIFQIIQQEENPNDFTSINYHAGYYFGDELDLLRENRNGLYNTSIESEQDKIDLFHVPMQCPYTPCELQFRSQIERLQHLMTHVGMKRYLCQFCETIFLTFPAVKEHSKTHPQAKHECPYCEKFYTNLAGFKSHLKYCIAGPKPATTKRASNSPLTNGVAKLARQNAAPTPVNFPCSHCGKTFTSIMYYGVHLRESHNLNTNGSDESMANRCPYCVKSFVDKENVRKHLKSCPANIANAKNETEKLGAKLDATASNTPSTPVNSTDVAFDLSKKSSTQHTSIPQRVTNVHGKPSSDAYRCGKCLRKFTSSEDVCRHLTSEHAHVLHVCSLCPKSTGYFTTSEQLAMHMTLNHILSPLDNAPVRCSFCAEEFPSAARLETHCATLHSHLVGDATATETTKLSLFNTAKLCQLCNKSYASAAFWANHMTHTHGWLRCPSCPGAFVDDATYIDHRENDCPGNNQSRANLLTGLPHQSPAPTADAPCYRCVACGKRLASNIGLKQHLVQFHRFTGASKHFLYKGREYSVCTYCTMVFGERSLWEAHNKRYHVSLNELREEGQNSSMFNSMSMWNGVMKSLTSAHNGNSSHLSNGNGQDGNANGSTSGLRCNMCKREFPDRISLLGHAFSCQAESAGLKCPSCDGQFDSKATLHAHALVCLRESITKQQQQPQLQPQSSFECLRCPAKFSNADKLQNHYHKQHKMSTTVGADFVQCQYCTKRFATADVLAIHVSIYHETGKQKPTVASALSQSNQSLACPICKVSGFAYGREGVENHLLVVHQIDVHSKRPTVAHQVEQQSKQTWPCTLCSVGATFENVQTLLMHQITAHASTDAAQLSSIAQSLTGIGGLLDLSQNNGSNNNTTTNNNNRTCTDSTGENNRSSSQGTGEDDVDDVDEFVGGGRSEYADKPLMQAASPSLTDFVQCRLCDSQCSNDEEFDIHLIVHELTTSQLPAFECPVCPGLKVDHVDDKVAAAAQILQHFLFAHDSITDVVEAEHLRFSCDDCDHHFAFAAQFEHHTRLHGRVDADATANTERCNCGQRCDTLELLLDHQRGCRNRALANGVQHSPSARSTSEVDVGEEDKPLDLNIHGNEAGNESKCSMKGKCVVSSRASSYRYNPSKSVLTCHFCQQTFQRHSELQKHMKLDHRLSEYPCHHCPSTFNRYKDLQTHLCTTHNIQTAKNICAICKQPFTLLKNLKRHLREIHKISNSKGQTKDYILFSIAST